MRSVRGVCVGLVCLLAFEAGARQAGVLDPTLRRDPYQGFPGTSRLYRPETGPDGAAVLATAPNKLGRYREQRFPAPKPAGEYRVFCVGGSSVHSDAFLAPDGSFPRMLELRLAGLLDGRTPRVVNSGGGGTGSIQNLEVVREVLGYQPDLVVIYPDGGEKNYVPPSPQGLMAEADDRHPVRTAARRCLARLRSYRAARMAWLALLPPSPPDRGVISAFSSLALFALSRPFDPENFARPFEMKTRGVPVLMPHPIPGDVIDRAHARYTAKLGEMVERCREAGVPVLLVQPVRNLKASFYLRFHIAPSEILSGRLAEWRTRYERGLGQIAQGRLEEAVETLRSVRALYVDDRDEVLAFQLGRCLERLGRPAQALAEYERPYLDHPVRGLIARVAAGHGVPLVDPYPAVVAASAGGIPGFGEFTDGFHPMPVTNRVIAESIVAAIVDLGLAGPLRNPAAPANAAATERLDRLVERLPAPLHTRMTAALSAGQPAAAVDAARSVPREQLLDTQLVESVLLGWALVRAGRIEEARTLHAELRLRYGRAAVDLPPLETDADMVRNAFAGDPFAWF
jgi:hypothetical protein